MRTTGDTSTLPFGILDGSEVRLMEFYDDRGTLWFKATEEIVSLDGLRKISVESKQHDGRCIDTAEYISRIGEILFEVLQSPPESSTLATFTSDAWCGTKTFGETVDVTFHAPVE